MERVVKVSIFSLIGLLILGVILTIYYSLNRYETLDPSESINLIKTNEAIRGGEPTHDITMDEEYKLSNLAEQTRIDNVSDNSPLKALEFLFASLALEDVKQFTYSFYVELILIDFQIFFVEEGKEQLKEVMNEISRDNTIQSIKYAELENNQFEVKILYEDEKEAKVNLTIEQTESVNYKNRPTFYNIVTSPLDIVEQINNTTQ